MINFISVTCGGVIPPSKGTESVESICADEARYVDDFEVLQGSVLSTQLDEGGG